MKPILSSLFCQTKEHLNLQKTQPTKTQTYEKQTYQKTNLQKDTPTKTNLQRNKPTKNQTYENTNLHVASGFLTTYATPELDLIVASP